MVVGLLGVGLVGLLGLRLGGLGGGCIWELGLLGVGVRLGEI